jgi:hypothetical protein
VKPRISIPDNDAISFEASTAPALFSAFETPKADSFAAHHLRI